MKAMKAEQTRFSATITEIRQETPTIKSFVLDYGDQPFEFRPGQWIDLWLDLDGEPAVAGYSMTSAPSRRGSIQLAVKYGANHRATRYLHQQARVGEQVTISTGSGNFYYERDMGSRVVLIGAGVGVTPLLSIFRHIHEHHRDVQVTLLYSVAVPEEVLFAEELTAIERSNPNARLLITVTRPEGTGWDGLTGRIDADKLRAAGLDEQTLYYICGPNEMVDATAAELAALGIPEANIIYEKWW